MWAYLENKTWEEQIEKGKEKQAHYFWGFLP